MNAVIQPGDVLRAGRYEIQEPRRSACDKKVFLAHDRELDCQVALDVFSNNPVMPNGRTMSAWETRVLGQLGDHPNIATVLDHWEDDGTAFMVTRYLSGGSLRDIIAHSQESGEGMSVDSALQISTEIARGLAHIHGRRILYRDLQPRNVLFDEWGGVHLVDFDTAVSLDDGDMSDLSHRPVIDYMAPELTDGGNADERADLYSLGATIYEMCSGRTPFAGTREEILVAHRAGPRPSLERGDLPEALRHFVFCLLAPQREQRPASAAEVVERLEGLRTARADLESLIDKGEAASVEFKQTGRCNTHTHEPDPRIERAVVRSVAGFMNAEGGTLLIGVTDAGDVSGIEADFPFVKRKNQDGFALWLNDLLYTALGAIAATNVRISFEVMPIGTVCRVDVQHGKSPTFARGGQAEADFYVRQNNATRLLNTAQALDYVTAHWS